MMMMMIRRRWRIVVVLRRSVIMRVVIVLGWFVIRRVVVFRGRQVIIVIIIIRSLTKKKFKSHTHTHTHTLDFPPQNTQLYFYTHPRHNDRHFPLHHALGKSAQILSSWAKPSERLKISSSFKNNNIMLSMFHSMLLPWGERMLILSREKNTSCYCLRKI